MCRRRCGKCSCHQRAAKALPTPPAYSIVAILQGEQVNDNGQKVRSGTLVIEHETSYGRWFMCKVTFRLAAGGHAMTWASNHARVISFTHIVDDVFSVSNSNNAASGISFRVANANMPRVRREILQFQHALRGKRVIHPSIEKIIASFTLRQLYGHNTKYTPLNKPGRTTVNVRLKGHANEFPSHPLIQIQLLVKEISGKAVEKDNVKNWWSQNKLSTSPDLPLPSSFSPDDLFDLLDPQSAVIDYR